MNGTLLFTLKIRLWKTEGMEKYKIDDKLIAILKCMLCCEVNKYITNSSLLGHFVPLEIKLCETNKFENLFVLT